MSRFSPLVPKLLWTLRAGLTVMALVWLTRFVLQNWGELVAAASRLDPTYLALAAVGAILGLVPGAWAWHRLLARDLPELEPTRGILVYLRSGIGKYTPGGALAFAIQHRALNDDRATPLRLIAVFVGTALAACLAAALLGLPAAAALLALPVWTTTLAIALPTLALLLWSSTWTTWPAFSKMLARLGLPAPRDFTITTLIMTCAWALTGLHLAALGLPFDASPFFLVSAFALSAIVGIVFAVLPGALGVRDGALALILSAQLAPADALTLALLSRALIVGADVFGTTAAALLLRAERGTPLTHRKAATS
ncbi:MAG: lysylphosphatidylglycerol synthase domain-containing protein [Paracoccaceae bacterium]|nr:lysylphosphatidylglycerol synthase domain-containing protein [Paracoccaceae bacterium]